MLSKDIMPTRTLNRIHFSDLDPLRFEDLCMNLVSRFRNWVQLNHYGRKGADGGIDIKAKEAIGEATKTWHIQCKRYSTIKKGDLISVVDSIKGELPDKLLLIIGCDLRRDLFEFFKDYCLIKGIADADIWTASNLESDLYHKHKDLLFIYFGIQVNRSHKSNETKVKYNLRMKKKMEKDFIDTDWFKKNGMSYDPRDRLKYWEAYIRSIDDETYPRSDKPSMGQICPWFRTDIYDFYHGGLEVWLSSASAHKVIMDKNGFWEPLNDYYDKRQEDSKYKTYLVKIIGQIPYHGIVDYDLDGDEYNSEPQIFCKFQFDGEPYERKYYRIDGSATEQNYDMELEDIMKKEFSTG